jgi:hypothetical protein
VKGADNVRDVLTRMLTDETPRKIDLLRTAWNLTEIEFPYAQKITSGEVSDNLLKSMDESLIMVINPRLNKITQIDIDPYGLAVYSCQYSAKIYIWTKASEWDMAIARRDRLALVCRLTMLEWPNLTPGIYGDSGYRLHQETYTEQFGEPTRITSATSNRTIAPALLAIDIDTEETLRDGSTRPPLGSADTVTPGAFAVGPTTPLPPTS